MRSLFEKEEKEIALNQLKLDLISRFYPFSKDDILQYKSILNFDRYHLMNNDSVKWDIELLDKVDAKIDWSALWKIKTIKFDIAFFKRYESKIEFSSIHLSKNIEWSNDLLSEYGDKFDWSKWLITKEPLSTIENLRRYKDILDWSSVSQRINIDFTEETLQEFSEKWDWKKLSANKNLPLSVEFIQKYMEKLDFDALSQNPFASTLPKPHKPTLQPKLCQRACKANAQPTDNPQGTSKKNTEPKLLWCIDNSVLRNPPLRQAPKRYRIWSIKFTVPKIGVSNSPSGRLTD
jgi:hypothetical protein